MPSKMLMQFYVRIRWQTLVARSLAESSRGTSAENLPLFAPEHLNLIFSTVDFVSRLGIAVLFYHCTFKALSISTMPFGSIQMRCRGRCGCGQLQCCELLNSCQITSQCNRFAQNILYSFFILFIQKYKNCNTDCFRFLLRFSDG